MTIRELRHLLAQFPDDQEVMVNRGEYGPCRITVNPRTIVVHLTPDGQSCWEPLYPELAEDDDLSLVPITCI